MSELPVNQILCGDCIHILSTFAKESVNLIVVDPPYNIGKAEWDSPKHYHHWLLARLRQCERILKPNGVLWLFHMSFPSLAKINQDLERETSFRFKQFITINKGLASIAGRTSNNLRSFPRATEYLIFYTFEDKTGTEQLSEKYQKINPMAQYLKQEFKRAKVSNKEIARLFPSRTGGLTGCVSNWLLGLNFPLKDQYTKMKEYMNRQHNKTEYLRRDYEELRRDYEELRYPFNLKAGITDVWNVNFYEELLPHPTSKPVKLMRRIIEATSNENEVMLDPFVGCGTSCVAAKQLDRKFIGIDINPEYVEIAKKRLSVIPEKLSKFMVVAGPLVVNGTEKEKSASHSILGYKDILNCIAGKVRKTRKGNFIIPLIDICEQEYGKVILEDDFNLDLQTVENVSLQTKKETEQ